MRSTIAILLLTAMHILVLAPAVVAGASGLPDIETFMQIGWAGAPHPDPDGAVVYFESGMSGVRQLYRLTPSGWPYQLTVFVDGIDFTELSPDAKRLIVGASEGGNERSQLYLVDGETGQLRLLTSKPEVRYVGPEWSPDGATLYYSTNEANGKDVQVYAMDVATGASRAILAREGNYFVSDISRDGRQLAVVRFYSNEATDLYLVDTAGGAERHLTPHEGNAYFSSTIFSEDGKSLYLIADGSPDGLRRLGSMDLATGKIRYLDPESRWEVEDLALSPGGRYLAWIENADGYGVVRLREVGGGKGFPGDDLPSPELRGVASDIGLTRDGVAFFTFNSATATSEVHRWDFRSRKLERLTNSTYAGIDPEWFRAPELVRYRSFDQREIPAFLYLPEGGEKGPVPFVIHVHGGPETQFRPEFTRHFQYLILHGYGILAPNIRGSSGYGREYLTLDNYRKRKDAVADVGAAARWLIDRGHTTRDMLAVKGDSYGGYMTLAALTEYPDIFAAGVEGVGIANFITFLQRTADYRRALREAEYGPLADSAFLREISPLTHVDRIRAPLLIIHGENDPRVPVGEARQIAAALTARGQVADTLIFADEGHGVAKRPNILIQYRRMVDFLDRHIKARPKGD